MRWFRNLPWKTVTIGAFAGACVFLLLAALSLIVDVWLFDRNVQLRISLNEVNWSGWATALVAFGIGVANFAPMVRQIREQNTISKIVLLSEEHNAINTLLNKIMLVKNSIEFKRIKFLTTEFHKEDTDIEDKIVFSIEACTLLMPLLNSMIEVNAASKNAFDSYTYFITPQNIEGVPPIDKDIVKEINSLAQRLSNLKTGIEYLRDKEIMLERIDIAKEFLDLVSKWHSAVLNYKVLVLAQIHEWKQQINT